MTEDLYATLGVPHDASQDAIRHAFLELAKTCHPDLHPNDPAGAEKFKQIHRAFERLYKPWRWPFRRVVFTPESVLQAIANRSRPGWRHDLRTRRVTVAALLLIFTGSLGSLFVVGIATRVEWPSARSSAGDSQASPRLRY
jgi:hypothetical protein